MVIRKFHVKKDERALLFYRGDFVDVLRPGEHYRFDPLFRFTAEHYSVADVRFDNHVAEYIARAEPQIAQREFHVIELGPTEVGLRYENGVLAEVLAPNTRRLYWRSYIDLAFERIDIGRDFEIEPRLVPQLVGGVVRGAVKVCGAEGVLVAQVPEYHVGVLYVDGRIG